MTDHQTHDHDHFDDERGGGGPVDTDDDNNGNGNGNASQSPFLLDFPQSEVSSKMIRQQSHPMQVEPAAGTMRGPHPNHHRLAATAPRPRIQRLLVEDSEISSDGGTSLGSDPEALIRTNLFAPPAVIRNDVFRPGAPGIMQPSYTRHHSHQPHLQHIHNSRSRSRGSANGSVAAPRTTPHKRSGNVSSITRTGNDHYCGLSAEIAREITAYRTPVKTPQQRPGKCLEKTPQAVMAPLSRDLFRAKASAPMTDSKLMGIRLTETASMSDSDHGSSSPGDVQQRGQPLLKQQALRDLNMQSAAPAKPVGQSSSVTAKNRRKSLGTALGTPARRRCAKKQKKSRKTPFAGISAKKKLKRTLTPPRNALGSHKGSLTRTSAAAAHTLSTAYDGVDDYRPTSSEHDPSPFQVDLPQKKEVLAHAKICALVDGYTAVHRDFNFALLSGISRPTLEKEYERSTTEKPMIAGSCHRDVVKQLLECAEDIVVEGFFREYTEDKENGEGTGSERMEACILSSESLRQIIVCFRGSTEKHARPLGKTSSFAKQAPDSSIFDGNNQNVPILSAFRAAYFGSPLETTVFALLANLSTRKPFFDVAMTGHSFGATMALLASVRYAHSNSQMRVSCTTFGCPKIGGEGWRQLVHSVSNLRVYRAENGMDPCVALPSGSEWVHCGHAIQIVGNADDDDIEFRARRFDRDDASCTHRNLPGLVQAKAIVKTLTQDTSQGRMDHEIQSYIDKLTQSGDKWLTDFCEVKGNGVNGTDNERRILA
ncbi:hypothetical protein ACHAWF_019007 [Thalassiosira exigua]